MPLVLRRDLNIPLTNDQVDANFEYLDERITTVDNKPLILPVASDTMLGAIRIGTGLVMSGDVLNNAGVTKVTAGTNVQVIPATGVGDITISAEHNHDALYSKLDHNHDLLYASLTHNHDALYSKLDHNHDLLYASLTHTHSDYAFTAGTGISIATDKKINLQPASSGTIGGVKAGTNITISADGTISAAGNTGATADHTHTGIQRVSLLVDKNLGFYDEIIATATVTSTANKLYRIHLELLNKVSDTTIPDSGTTDPSSGAAGTVYATYLVAGPSGGNALTTVANVMDPPGGDIYGIWSMRYNLEAFFTTTSITVRYIFSQSMYSTNPAHNSTTYGIPTTNNLGQEYVYKYNMLVYGTPGTYGYWQVKNIQIEEVEVK